MAQKNFNAPLAVITLLFFMWGFITCLNDILIPYLKGVFDLSYFQANLVQFAFFGAYFIGSLIYYFVSLKFGDPIGKIGYKKGMLAGLVTAALACLLFYPAAQLHSYGLFLSALFCLGLGLTMLQIAANPYVALLGKPETASSRLNLAQAFNSFGTTIAPIIGGFLIFQYFFKEGDNADAVKTPYLFLALSFLAVAFIVSRFRLPEVHVHGDHPEKPAALKFPHLRWGMLAIFCYVGAEVAIGSNLVSFLGHEAVAGLSEQAASKYLALYWGGAMTGRFVGALYLSSGEAKRKLLGSLSIFGLSYVFISLITGFSVLEMLPFAGLMMLNFMVFIWGRSVASKTLSVFALMAAGLLLIGSHSGGNLALWSIIGVGLFNSIMWSNIFTLSIAGLRQHTGQGSSLLVMMILGGALIAPAQGLVADMVGIRLSFLVPVLCYVYLFYFGARGYKIKPV
jgi:FHS family L-fucose permease-like MFS transporter